MTRRVLHLWFHALETDWLQKHRPRLADLPLLTVQLDHGRNVIVQANKLARKAGAAPGMSLVDAHAVCPQLAVLDHSGELVGKILQSMADWCDRYTPLVSLCGDDALWLDITGCAHLYGGEAALCEHVKASFKNFGYDCAVAIASTPGVAWAAARYTQLSLIADGQERQLLNPLPPDALRCDSKISQNLKRLGLRTIGEIFKIPRPALSKRFGNLLCHAIDLALGDLREPISPRKPTVFYSNRYEFIEPVQHEEPIRLVLGDMLPRLCRQLEEAQRGARQIQLTSFRVDGYVQRITIGTNKPTVAPDHLLKLLSHTLQEIDAGLGIELILLAATKTELLRAKGNDLLDNRIGRKDRIAETIDTINIKLGPAAVYQQFAQETHLVERAAIKSLPLSEAQANYMPLKDRPTRLLRWPRPITVMARVPDDPPMQFTWDGRTYRVSRADGPERIESEWWRGIREVRDYYCIEDTYGHRYGVYRSGSYLPDRQPEWFIYGEFA